MYKTRSTKSTRRNRHKQRRERVKRPFINICGIKNYEESHAALDCGASAVGFLVNVEQGARNQISADDARYIISKLPSDTPTVLVTHFTNVKNACDLIKHTKAKTLHIGNDIEIDELKLLLNDLPDINVLKSIHVNNDNAIAIAQRYCGTAHALVLDTIHGACFGGTGMAHDWSISQKIARTATLSKIYLSGGLNPENVHQAIKLVGPDGVSVCSGVENADRSKARHLMKLFIEEALSAFAN